MLGSQTTGDKDFDKAMNIIASASDPEATSARIAEMAAAKADMNAASDRLGVAREIEAARQELKEVKVAAEVTAADASAYAAKATRDANTLSAQTSNEAAETRRALDTERAELNDDKLRLEARWAHVREQTGTLENQLAKAAETMGEATVARGKYVAQRDALQNLIHQLDQDGGS